MAKAFTELTSCGNDR